MLRRFMCSAAICLPLVACGGTERPPSIDLNPSLGSAGAPDKGDGGADGGGGKQPTDNDLRKGGFINLPQVSDILYDDLRGVLYVSTTQGGLATVNLENGKISSQKIGEGPLLGLDLSPSGDKLLLCENAVDAEAKQYWIHIADLAANTLREVYFEQTYYLQEGTHGAVFADERTIYLSTSFTAGGYVDLVRLTLAEDASELDLSEEVGGVYSDAMYARSLDNSTVVVSEADDAGTFAVIDTASLVMKEGLLNARSRNVAVNAEASKLAFATNKGIKIRTKDASAFYNTEDAIEQDEREARDAVWSPVSNSLYVTWGPKVDKTPGFVERYDADTLESEGIVQNAIKLADMRDGGFPATRMRISKDGTLLFITVETGINVIKVEP